MLEYGLTGDFQYLRAYATASPFFLHTFWIHFKKIPLCLHSAQRGLPWCWAFRPQGELESLQGRCPFLGMAIGGGLLLPFASCAFPVQCFFKNLS